MRFTNFSYCSRPSCVTKPLSKGGPDFGATVGFPIRPSKPSPQNTTVNRRDIVLDRSIGAIEVIASVDDVTHRKPDPEIYLQAANLSAFNKFTQAEAEMFRKFTHLMFS